MASNHKLTALLKGRTVQGAHTDGTTMTLALDDGSNVTIQTGGAASGPTAGGIIQAVRQAGTMLDLDFEDKTTLQITLAEATSSVMVRDRNHVMQYAD